ncbi:MAG: bifunctional metallophosphatase/5'-nucleotidase [Deltaproteobacteria bacterium]|nr:bifunctional metallophosphatase/5'-nucleotidase [Deltaproteobacteria bacterium]
MLILFLACTPLDPEAKPDDTADTAAPQGPFRVTILHTNDWQSHMLGFGPNREYTPGTTGDDDTVGGLARLATKVAEIKAASDRPVVLYDGGDWMAGDLFQLLATTEAAELSMMGSLRYDAVTLGNHEFDWGPQVLGTMISLADARGVQTPILASNTVPNASDSGDDLLEAHFESGRIQSHAVHELDTGLRIGLFGILGDSAQSITPAVTPASFSPATDASIEAVAALEAEGVDLVVALTHNGVTDDPSTSPDDLLAADVPQIDVIVGGHSHTPLFEPRTVGSTVIVQAGALTQYLGQLDLAQDDEGNWTVESYQLHELDDEILGDSDVTSEVDAYKAEVEAGPLVDIGYGYDEPVYGVPASMPATGCTETALGNFVTDAFRHAMNALDPADPIEFSFESQGVIRDPIDHGQAGVQGFSDAFRVLPLGFGNDDLPGYALVDFYVTGAELLDVCEVTASVSPSYGCNYFIEVSGMRCNLDMSRGQFNRAQSIERQLDDGTWESIDSSKDATALYHVAVDSYVASLMGILESLTYGLMVITAKDESGVEYTDVDSMVFDADPSTPEVDELKLWQALIAYGQSFDDADGDGVSDLPSAYAAPAGRIVGYD